MSGQGRASVFVVGRNPQEDSKLPYLLRLPLEGGLVLKARELWPATARVYCHRFEQPWPQEAEIVEQTPVLLCRRRGAAIDLVLDRPPACPLPVRLHAGQGARGDLLADAEDRPCRQPGRQDPTQTHPHRAGHDHRRHPRALPLPLRPAGGRNGPGNRPRRRLRGLQPRRDDARPGRAQEPRQPRRHTCRRNARLPAVTTRRAPARRGCRRGQIRGAVQARTRRRQLARRPTRPARGPLPRSPPRLRRLPPLRRRLDLPLPHHRTRRRHRPQRRLKPPHLERRQQSNPSRKSGFSTPTRARTASPVATATAADTSGPATAKTPACDDGIPENRSPPSRG